MNTSDSFTTENLTIVERSDRFGVYFTPIVPTPSGRGTMAAWLATPHGSVCGPRYSTRDLAERAVVTSAETE